MDLRELDRIGPSPVAHQVVSIGVSETGPAVLQTKKLQLALGRSLSLILARNDGMATG